MKIAIAGLLILLAALFYSTMVPVTITAPLSAEPDSLVTVTASGNTGFIVSGAKDYKIIGNTLVLLTANTDVEIITAGPTKTVIHVGTPTPLASLIHQAPAAGRTEVAESLRAIATSNDVKSVEELVKLTRINNRTLIEDNWKPWFTALSAYLEANHQTADLPELKELWITIANQLDGIF